MKPLIVVVALALFQGTVPSSFGGVTNRVIATSGDPLPGASNHIVFSQSLGNGLKVINSGGDVAFIGSLRNTNTGDLFNDNALVLANAGGLQKVGRTGDGIPGVTGQQFGVFSALALDTAAHFAVRDAVSFEDRLLHNLSGPWQIVARVNAAATNPPGGNFVQVFAGSVIGSTPVIRPSGTPQWLFQASTIPPFTSGLWALTPTGQSYQPLPFNALAPGLAGGELLESNEVAVVSPPPVGTVAFRGFLKMGTAGVSFGNREVLYYGTSPESVQVLLRTGDAVPVSAGTGTLEGFRGPDVNQNGQLCFIADWFGTESLSGIFLKDTGAPVLLAKTGDIAPATDGKPAGTFTGFGDAAINAAGQVVFNAFVANSPSEGGGSYSGLYLWETGTLKLIVRTGQFDTWTAAPTGWHFTLLKRWNVNASGAVAFFGQARNANNTQTTDGLWVATGGGGPQLVAYTGFPFATPPPGVVALSLLRDPDPFSATPPAGGADGRVRFLADSNNAVVFSGTFPAPNNNSAIFVSQVTHTRQYVLPHFTEVSGNVNNTQYTFDTELFATYTAGQLLNAPAPGASLDLYLYNNSGQILQVNGQDVCAPCSFQLSTNARKLSINFDTLLAAHGAFTVAPGYATMVVGGDADHVNLEGFFISSKTSPFDLDTTVITPQPVSAPVTGTTNRYVLPHFVEASGTSINTQYTFDTTLFATYTAGQLDNAPAPGAGLDLFLYDDSSQILQVNGQDVCAPCSFQLSTNTRKLSITFDALLAAHGAFTVAPGYATMVVTGDTSHVNLEGFLINAKTGPFDLDTVAITPQRVSPPFTTTTNRYVLPHFTETSGTISTTPFTFDTTLFATYTAAQIDTNTAPGAGLDLYLYDNGGQILKVNSQDVCAPCSFQLSTNTRKLSITFDALLQAKGAFTVAPGYATMVVTGDAGHVNLEGLLVNSRSNAVDLAITAITPQPMSAPAAATTNRYVLPHFVEASGTSINTQYTFDTTLAATYTAGQLDNTAAPGASLDLYLFGNNGQLLQISGQNVCAPCSFQLSTNDHKLNITFDALLQAKGAFGVEVGYAAMVVGGDADHVNLEGFLVNAKTGPFDLDIAAITPQRLAAETALPFEFRFLRVPALDNAQVRLAVATQVGVTYELQVSTNLFDWNPRPAIVATNVTHEFIESLQPGPGYFYRVRQGGP